MTSLARSSAACTFGEGVTDLKLCRHAYEQKLYFGQGRSKENPMPLAWHCEGVAETAPDSSVLLAVPGGGRLSATRRDFERASQVNVMFLSMLKGSVCIAADSVPNQRALSHQYFRSHCC